MSVYREGYNAVKVIEQQSTQIFNDACDYGAPTVKGDAVWNAAQTLKTYAIEGTRKVNKTLLGNVYTIEIKLIDEWAVSDERKTLAQATERYRLTYTQCANKRLLGTLIRKDIMGFFELEKI